MISVNEMPLQVDSNCFESALFLCTPSIDQCMNKVTCPKYGESHQHELEGLIDQDLLQEINSCCSKKKQVLSHNQNVGNKTPEKNNKSKQLYAFPDGGWVCSLCKNYNFCGRLQCNRCCKKREKEDYNGKPKHLQRFDGKYDKKKMSLMIREGDWNCPFCDNINFSFRTQCNKCHKGKEDAFASQPCEE